MYRNGQRSSNGGTEFFMEPSTPPVHSRSSSLRKNGEEQVSPSELSPGLLDLHSLDTELLPEVRPVSTFVLFLPAFCVLRCFLCSSISTSYPFLMI